jgi:hypothetical protein
VAAVVVVGNVGEREGVGVGAGHDAVAAPEPHCCSTIAEHAE